MITQTKIAAAAILLTFLTTLVSVVQIRATNGERLTQLEKKVGVEIGKYEVLQAKVSVVERESSINNETLVRLYSTLDRINGTMIETNSALARFDAATTAHEKRLDKLEK